MAEPKVVRGTIGGVTVETTQEIADRLTGTFEPETKTTAKRASSSKSSK